MKCFDFFNQNELHYNNSVWIIGTTYNKSG